MPFRPPSRSLRAFRPLRPQCRTWAVRLRWAGLNFALIPLWLGLAPVILLVAASPLYPARTCRRNLRERLGFTMVQRWLGTATVLFHYAFYLAEVFLFHPLQAELCDNADAFQAFVALLCRQYGRGPGRSIVVLAAHYGNVEAMGEVAARTLQGCGLTLVVLAKPARLGFFARALTRYRERRGLLELPTNAVDLRLQMEAAEGRGQALGLLVDQKPRHGGPWLEFLGAPAAFPKTGVSLLQAQGQPFLLTTARRLLPGAYTFLFAEAWNAHCAGFDSSSRVVAPRAAQAEASGAEDNDVLRSYVGWLEAVVREVPLQWFWDYAKWSRRPPG